MEAARPPPLRLAFSLSSTSILIAFLFLQTVKGTLSIWLLSQARRRKKLAFELSLLSVSLSRSLALARWTPRAGASPLCASSSQEGEEQAAAEATGAEPRHRRRWLSPRRPFSPRPLLPLPPPRRLGPRRRPTPGEEETHQRSCSHSNWKERRKKESSPRGDGFDDLFHSLRRIFYLRPSTSLSRTSNLFS